MEASWLIPPEKFKSIHSAGNVLASIFSYSQRVIMIDYLEQGGTINGTYLAATPGNCKEKARKTDLLCSAVAGLRPCPHVTRCHDCCD